MVASIQSYFPYYYHYLFKRDCPIFNHRFPISHYHYLFMVVHIQSWFPMYYYVFNHACPYSIIVSHILLSSFIQTRLPIFNHSFPYIIIIMYSSMIANIQSSFPMYYHYVFKHDCHYSVIVSHIIINIYSITIACSQS